MNSLKTSIKLIFLVVLLAIIGYAVFWIKDAFKPVSSSKDSTATSTAPIDQNEVPLTIKTIKEQSSDDFQISVEYPQFPSLGKEFNDSIHRSVTDRLTEFKGDAERNYQARTATAAAGYKVSRADFNFIARWEPAQLNSKYVSFILRFDSYTGGANENQELQTFNYDIAADKQMALADMFPKGSNYLQTLSSLSRSQLAASLKEAGGGNYESAYLAEGTAPVKENFEKFTFTEYMLTIYFPKYWVAPGAFGEQRATIPLKDIGQ